MSPPQRLWPAVLEAHRTALPGPYLPEGVVVSIPSFSWGGRSTGEGSDGTWGASSRNYVSISGLHDEVNAAGTGEEEIV